MRLASATPQNCEEPDSPWSSSTRNVSDRSHWTEPPGRPRTHWWYYILQLVWEYLRISWEDLESVARSREIWGDSCTMTHNGESRMKMDGWRDGGTDGPMEIWGHTVNILIWTAATAYTGTHTTTSVWQYKRLGAAQQSKKRNEIISKQWRILCAEYKASNWHTKKKTYIISPSFSISHTPIVYVHISSSSFFFTLVNITDLFAVLGFAAVSAACDLPWINALATQGPTVHIQAHYGHAHYVHEIFPCIYNIDFRSLMSPCLYTGY